MEQPVKTTHENGTRGWYQHGKLHRDDGPAFIWADGTQEWYQHGKLHRDEAAAWIGADGTQGWYQHGKLHRVDGPAWVNIDGTQGYWLNDTKLEEGSLALKLFKERERRRETGYGTTN